jgi:hypothetical protein
MSPPENSFVEEDSAKAGDGRIAQCVVLGPCVASGQTASHAGVEAIRTVQDAATAAVLQYTDSLQDAVGCTDEGDAMDDISMEGVSQAVRDMASQLRPNSMADAAVVAAMGDAWGSSLASLDGRMAVNIGILGDDSSWLPVQDTSGWLKHVSHVIAAAVRLTRLVDECGYSVMVHCSDGWDRTSQIVALAQVMLAPYFRTFEGFAVLVEKDWCSFGHKLQDRLGRGVGGRGSHETSPVFLQWLDAVHQLLVQMPWAFEFNSAYLAAVGTLTQSCWFDNMLCNTPQQRFAMRYAAAQEMVHAVRFVVDDPQEPSGLREVPPPRERSDAYWSTLLALSDAMPCMWRHLWAHRPVFSNPQYMAPNPATLMPMPLPPNVHVIRTHDWECFEEEGSIVFRRIWQRSQVLQVQHSTRCLVLWTDLFLHWGKRVRTALCREAQWVLQSLAYVPDELLAASGDLEAGSDAEPAVSERNEASTLGNLTAMSSPHGVASPFAATSASGLGAQPPHTATLRRPGIVPASGRNAQAKIARQMGSSRASIVPVGMKRLMK